MNRTRQGRFHDQAERNGILAGDAFESHEAGEIPFAAQAVQGRKVGNESARSKHVIGEVGAVRRLRRGCPAHCQEFAESFPAVREGIAESAQA